MSAECSQSVGHIQLLDVLGFVVPAPVGSICIHPTLEPSLSVMLWEEFSSVLLLPPGGKFEDRYAHFNAVDCYWTQKQESSKENLSGVFSEGQFWPGWI